MGFERTGRKAVVPALLQKYETLKSLEQVGEEPSQPDRKKAYQQADGRLEAQIRATDAAAADPAIASLSGQLHADRLAVSDPIQAAYFQNVVQKYREDFQRIASGQQPTRHLEQEELRAFLLLAGNKLSREEAYMLRMLEPLMTLEQREIYRDARKLDFELEGHSLSPTDLAKLALQMYAPYTPVVGAAMLGSYGLVTGEALSVTLITAMSGGLTVGEYLQQKAIKERKGTYGVNFLEDPQVANELHRLHQVVSQPIPELAKIGERLEGDIGTFEALLALRAAAPQDPERDAPVVAQFIGYLEAAKAAQANLNAIVEQAAGQPIDPSVLEQYVQRPLAEARATFLKQVKPEELEQLKAGIRPARVLSDEQVRVAINRLVSLNISETLSLVNAPLSHLIHKLEKDIDVEQHLEARSAPKLDSATIEALRVAVGKEPSFPEIMGLSKLIYSGALELKDLWPNVEHQLLQGKTKFDARELISDVAKLGFDDYAKWQERFGKLLKGPLAQGLGVGGMSAVILLTELAFWPWGFVAGFGPRILGWFLGDRIERSALEKRATKGIDYVGGRPNATEYEVLLDRYRDPKRFLEANPAELKQLCATEVGVIRRMIEGLESIIPLLGTKDRQDFETHQKPIYDALKTFASRLEELGKGDPNQIAAGFQSAWSQLFSPDLARIAQRDILRQASVDDFVADPRARLVNAKLTMINSLKQLLDGDGQMSFPDFVAAWKHNNLRNDAFVQLAQKVKEAGDDFDRSQLKLWQKIASGIPFIGKAAAKGHELDEIEQFAAQVISARWNPAALSELMKLYERHSELEAKLDTELRDHWPVNEERAKAIAQEMLDVMWERVHPVFGNVEQGAEHPRFVGSAELKSDERGTYYLVTGEIDGGKGKNGKLEIRVDPYGIVDLDSIKSLDLGEAVLKKFAMEAVENAIGAKAKNAALLEGGDGTDYRFEVRMKNGDRFAVNVSPDGFSRLESIGPVA